MTAISLDSAAVVTERSKRTWQRRLADGGIARLPDDARGRTMVDLQEVAPAVCIPLNAADLAALVRADAGQASCQSDIGQLFAAHGKREIALYWLRQAADQADPDAMQCLGRMYAAGEGVEQDSNRAMMWIAKAAAHGHAVAQAQMQGLLPGA